MWLSQNIQVFRLFRGLWDMWTKAASFLWTLEPRNDQKIPHSFGKTDEVYGARRSDERGFIKKTDRDRENVLKTCLSIVIC